MWYFYVKYVACVFGAESPTPLPWQLLSLFWCGRGKLRLSFRNLCLKAAPLWTTESLRLKLSRFMAYDEVLSGGLSFDVCSRFGTSKMLKPCVTSGHSASLSCSHPCCRLFLARTKQRERNRRLMDETYYSQATQGHLCVFVGECVSVSAFVCVRTCQVTHPPPLLWRLSSCFVAENHTPHWPSCMWGGMRAGSLAWVRAKLLKYADFCETRSGMCQ